jgi:hypothetical protein
MAMSDENNHEQLFCIKATSSERACIAVAPVETTTSCELSYVRTGKTRNTPGSAV